MGNYVEKLQRIVYEQEIISKLMLFIKLTSRPLVFRTYIGFSNCKYG